MSRSRLWKNNNEWGKINRSIGVTATPLNGNKILLKTKLPSKINIMPFLVVGMDTVSKFIRN